MKKLWFVRKRYGWGWTPSSWEGWVVLLVWLILFVSLVKKIQPGEVLTEMIFIIILTSLLLLICYIQGEKPKWQWGNEKSSKNK
jgi:uncharacterized membrane protein YhaH (DUF805 family)